jgi:hypothetical protein
MGASIKNSILFVGDGIRLSWTSTTNRMFPPKKYAGSVEQICRGIIDDCFDRKKKFFRVSPNNFKQFYARDFGMCCESLLALGYKEQVRETLIYTMDIYKKSGKITTHITTFGSPVNFPNNTPESAAYMLHSLILLGDKDLLSKYKFFFLLLAEKTYNEDVDKKTGLLRKDKHFSSMKDHSLRKSDCYNNCLLAMFANDLKKIGIKSSLSKYNYKKTIAKNFIKNGYFLEDLSGRNIFTGDANVFPFWTKMYNDVNLQQGIIRKIKEKKLDEPWPLKYTTKEDVEKKPHFANFFVPGYEGDTLWIHLGLCYMKTLRGADDKLLKKYISEYESLIIKHKTFYEVYDSNGKIFERFFYKSDEAMLWCSIFLELCLNEKKQKIKIQ